MGGAGGDDVGDGAGAAEERWARTVDDVEREELHKYPPPPPLPATCDDYRALERLIERAGGEVRVRATAEDADEAIGGGRGLRTTCDIAPGEVVLRVPPSLIIRASDDAHNDGALSRALRELPALLHAHGRNDGGNDGDGQDSDDDDDGHGADDRVADTALLIALLRERLLGAASRHAAFLSCMPPTYTSPLVSERLEERYAPALRGTPLWPLIDALRAELAQTYCEIIPWLRSQHADALPRVACTYALFRWAFGGVESRAFKLLSPAGAGGGGGGACVMLVPMLDMANHSGDAAVAHRFDDAFDRVRGLTLRNRKAHALPRGGALWLNYGDGVPNWRLLLHYGFALRSLEHDSIDVLLDDADDALLLQDETEGEEGKVESHVDDYESSIRRAMLFALAEPLGVRREHTLYGRTASESVTRDVAPPPAELLMSLRLLCARAEELAELRVDGLAPRLSAPLSARCERRVVSRLTEMLQALRVSFSPGAADGGVDSSQACSQEERFALVYCAGQRRILERCLRWLEEYSDGEAL